MAKRVLGVIDNLAELEDLDEATLLKELQVRFSKDQIYTYVGEILVTVNPFKWIDGAYDPDKMRQYTSVGDKKRLPPHIYATADLAFNAMVSAKKNQVCVISGESGAGKTEAAKLFVKQLVTVSNGSEFEGLEQKLIDVNPVLEAFGNAKTLMNDNSSRFGKFTNIHFNEEGAIKGAQMTEYLLEKSRVVFQAPGEQNFHVFYYLFTGVGSDERYGLGRIDDYRFTCDNRTACSMVGGREFTEMYQEMMQCFSVIGFGEEKVEDLFHLLAGIVTLGNIEFDNDDAAEIVSDASVLSTTCDQLGVDEGALELALTRQILVIQGEETERKLRLEQAEDVRDAAAKAIYKRAFSWIIVQCNEQTQDSSLRRLPTDCAMGILDIFGFECFDSNSFEQLCINLTNEQLQWFFNEHIFAMELAEYAKEGITGKDISYENNEPLLELILNSKPPLGMLSIIDEESNFPKATDSTMTMKLHEAFSKHKDYTRPRGNEQIFTLKHYAGEVTYEADGFLEKNRDTLAVDVIGALRLSENTLVRGLFGGEGGDGGDGGGGGAKSGGGRRKPKGARNKLDRKASQGRMRQSVKHARASLAKKKVKTVAANFKASLAELMTALKAAEPHFVRCIKPNHEKTPDYYNEELVLKQLRYTGMLETTRIRREGYSSRPLFADFVQRYKVLGFPCRQDVRANAEACRQILEKAGVDGYAVGKTKVFLRYFHADQLNGLLQPFQDAATILSKYCRGFTARSKYGALLAAKRAQDEAVNAFCNIAERNGAGMRDVVISLCEEDDKRPPEALASSAPPPPAQPVLPAKKNRAKRAASVKWFKEVESKKGAGQSDDGGFASWFHGIITRGESEQLLKDKQSGSFLIRVAESRFGYSLSLIFQGRIKHFMIDQDDAQQYMVVGNDRTFPSLNEVVAFHQRHPVTDDGDTLIHPCPVNTDENLAELE